MTPVDLSRKPENHLISQVVKKNPKRKNSGEDESLSSKMNKA